MDGFANEGEDKYPDDCVDYYADEKGPDDILHGGVDGGGKAGVKEENASFDTEREGEVDDCVNVNCLADVLG